MRCLTFAAPLWSALAVGGWIYLLEQREERLLSWTHSIFGFLELKQSYQLGLESSLSEPRPFYPQQPPKASEILEETGATTPASPESPASPDQRNSQSRSQDPTDVDEGNTASKPDARISTHEDRRQSQFPLAVRSVAVGKRNRGSTPEIRVSFDLRAKQPSRKLYRGSVWLEAQGENDDLVANSTKVRFALRRVRPTTLKLPPVKNVNNVNLVIQLSDQRPNFVMQLAKKHVSHMRTLLIN